MLFEYKAIKDNKIVTKTIDSDNEQMVLNFLKANGYFPIEIKEKTSVSVTSLLPTAFRGVKFSDIVDFTRQLAIMLNAGLTVVESLEILKKQTTNKAVVTILDDIDKRIKSGDSLSSALRTYPYFFSSLYIGLVKAGEASGKLADIMLKLAEDLEKSREFKARLRGALIYPAVIVSAMIVVIFVMITFVVPKLLALYEDFGVELPFMTKVILSVGNFTAATWPIILLLIIGSIFLLIRYFKTRLGKIARDRLLLRLPLFSKVIKLGTLVDATRTLAILIAAGVSILESLTIVIDTTNNVIYQQAFQSIYKKVEKGESLGKAFEEEGVFPPILIQMTIVGESTGNLDDTLTRLARYFETESDLAIKGITTLIEPAILVILGVMVGFLVFTIITPIYNLTSSFQ